MTAGTLGALAPAIHLLNCHLLHLSWPPALSQVLIADHDDEGPTGLRLTLRLAGVEGLRKWRAGFQLLDVHEGIEDGDVVLGRSFGATQVSMRAPLVGRGRPMSTLNGLCTALHQLVENSPDMPVEYLTVAGDGQTGEPAIVIAVEDREDVLRWRPVLPRYTVNSDTWAGPDADLQAAEPITYSAVGRVGYTPVCAYALQAPDCGGDLEAIWDAS